MAESYSLRERVVRHSKLHGKTALYPGNDYDHLADFLEQSFNSNRINIQNSPDGSPEPFVVIHDLRARGQQPLTFTSDVQGLEQFKTYEHQSTDSPRLIFLRGYPSLGWLQAVFETFNVDPALYQRYLLFPKSLGGESINHYSIPPPLSCLSSIFWLNITTLCLDETANTSAVPEDIENLRRQASEHLRRYHLDLSANANVGDTVVRQFSILNRRFSVVEQTISIGINRTPTSWNAIIWMDNARDLSRSAPGPWFPMDRIRAWTTYMFPIIQHRDYLAVKNKALEPQSNYSTASTTLWEANQNACLLPFQYGQFLDQELLPQDALYALSDVFRLSAASEGQFLNLIHDQIDHELQISTKLDNASMVNLRYIKKILDDHINRLTETVIWLGNQDQFMWPSAVPETMQRKVADSMKNILLGDFSHIRQRAERLSDSCQKGMESLASAAAYRESAKGVVNTERVEKLTLLATIFIPLSFTCSLFGMNFSIFGQGQVALWVFFPTAAVVLTISYLLWYIASWMLTSKF